MQSDTNASCPIYVYPSARMNVASTVRVCVVFVSVCVYVCLVINHKYIANHFAGCVLYNCSKLTVKMDVRINKVISSL